MNICVDIFIFHCTLCVKLLYNFIMCYVKSLHNLFYCKNYVVSNVVSSQILCVLDLCYYKSSIEFNSTGNVNLCTFNCFE